MYTSLFRKDWCKEQYVTQNNAEANFIVLGGFPSSAEETTQTPIAGREMAILFN